MIMHCDYQTPLQCSVHLLSNSIIFLWDFVCLFDSTNFAFHNLLFHLVTYFFFEHSRPIRAVCRERATVRVPTSKTSFDYTLTKSQPYMTQPRN